MRRRFLLLSMVSMLALALTVPASAPASRKSERKQNRNINTNFHSIQTATRKIQDLVNSVTLLGAGGATIQSALTQLAAGLTAAGNGLTALKAAVQDPTTGLVGLNNARTQFGVFKNDGTFLGGTGAHPPAKGPSGNATEGPGGTADAYVIDFGNDVSGRFLSVTLFPTGPTAPSNRTPMAVDCAASPGAASLCGTVEGVASDSSPNHVLVQFGAFGTGAADTNFSVAAISG